MAKTPSKKLFHLIHSLSSQEKRYFKVISNQKGESNHKYIRLFELIDSDKVFNEDVYRKKLYPDLSPKSKKYSELKNYLYQFILKSLRDFDESNSIDYSIKNGLLNIHSLFNRSRFENALDECRRVLKSAIKHEQFSAVLELLEWKKKIAYARSDIQYLNKNLASIQEREEAALKKFKNYKTYQHIFFQLYLFLRKKPNHKKKDLAIFIENSILTAPEKALSHKALIYYHRIWSIYYFSIGKFQKFARENEILIQQIEGHPHFLKEDISDYIAVLSNHSVSGFLTKNYQLVEKSLAKLKEINPITQDDTIRIRRQYYSNRFKYCILSGNFEEGLGELEVLKDLTAPEHWKIFNNDSFLFQYFYLHFGVKDYEKALDYLNEWNNLPRHAERRDMQMVARILLLLIHYEMDNTLLISSLIRSSRRYLGKKQNLPSFESSLFQHFSEIIRSKSRQEIHESFIRLQQKIKGMSSRTSPLFNIFDFKAWIESKVTGRNFAAIIKDKFEANY